MKANKSNNPCILTQKINHYVSSYAFKNISSQLSDIWVKTDHKDKKKKKYKWWQLLQKTQEGRTQMGVLQAEGAEKASRPITSTRDNLWEGGDVEKDPWMRVEERVNRKHSIENHAWLSILQGHF